MKTLNAVLFCCAAVSNLGQAQTAQVHIAGTDYPVLFADTNLSSEVRQRIASDLSIVFSPTPSFEKALGGGTHGRVAASVPLPGGGTAIETVNGRNYWEGVFKPNTFAAMFSEARREGFFLVDYDNQKSVRLGKVASSNYLHAFALVDARSNALQKAHAFAAALTNSNLLSQPAQELKVFYHFTPEDEQRLPELAYGGLIKDIQQSRVLEISVLNGTLQKRPEAGGAEVLVLLLGILYRPSPEEPQSLFGLEILYHDNRWGLAKPPLL